MTHKNLALSEKAIKNHCKRLKKELQFYNQDLSLAETQQLFSKILGFTSFHELKNILHNEKQFIHPFNELIKNFDDKNNEKEFFVVLIKPVNSISTDMQKKLKEYIYSLPLGIKEQKISIDHISINEHFCSIYLDPKSEFSHLSNAKIMGVTVDGALNVLTRTVSHYLTEHGFTLFDHIEYIYKIKNNTRFSIHLEDLILERDKE